MDFAAAQAEVDRWFAEKIACGPIARDTPAYNQALAAKDDLKARLGAILGAPAPLPPLPGPAPAAKATDPQPETPAEPAAPQE